MPGPDTERETRIAVEAAHRAVETSQVEDRRGGRDRGGNGNGGVSTKQIIAIVAALLGTNGITNAVQNFGVSQPALQQEVRACDSRVDQIREEEQARSRLGWEKYSRHKCLVHDDCEDFRDFVPRSCGVEQRQLAGFIARRSRVRVPSPLPLPGGDPDGEAQGPTQEAPPAGQQGPGGSLRCRGWRQAHEGHRAQLRSGTQ